MGIRRRRKKINTILTTIDRRLKSVELQRVPSVIKEGTITKRMLSKSIQLSLDTSADSAAETPGTTTPKPPEFRTKPFTNIVKIVYRGYNEVGTANDRDRARVYFETDPGLNVGDKIKFAAVTGSLDLPSKTTEYTVKEVGIVDGYNTVVYFPGRGTISNGAKTYDKGWRIRVANITVTGAIVDEAGTKFKFGQIILDGKDTTPAANDDYTNGPTWPAGIATTSGIHFTGGGFDVGDLINIDGLGSLFDGTHKVTFKEVINKRITLRFEFKDYPSAPVQLPSSSGAMRGAAGRYLRDGETWTDTSVEPALTWVWDDQRQLWWNASVSDLPEGVLVDDGVPPKPPTGLSGTAQGYILGSSSFSRVNLNWVAPTQNSNNTNLSDLKGYSVFFRYASADPWKFYSDTAAASETIEELLPNRTVFFAVKAFDVTRNTSTFSTSVSILTVAGATGLNAPSKPNISSRLGQLRVTWNGLDANGATPPAALIRGVQVHWSVVSGFTPNASTLKGFLSGKNDFFSDIDPVYGVPYHFRFVFLDISNVTSAASVQEIGSVAPLVDTDLILGSLTRWPFGANTVNVASIANGSISATTLVSGNDADGTAIRIEGKIAAGSIGATAIAANSIVAGKIAVDAIEARHISALSIEVGKLAANSVTADNIVSGSITSDKIDATTRIRLGDSNSTAPANYIEFGFVTLPGTGVSAPGIIGQYQNQETFYLGGWNNGQNSSGFSLGVISGDNYNDVIAVSGYDNGLGAATSLDIVAGALELRAIAGSFSDPRGVDITAQGGPIRLVPQGGNDETGNTNGVRVSKEFLVGKTSIQDWQEVEGTHIFSGFIASANSSGQAIGLSRRFNNGAVAAFYRGTQTIVGSISVTATATSYITSSDYRLKENIIPLDGAIEKLRLLKPRTFNFISEPDETVDGFIAHEVQEAVPLAATGTKDALDKDGAPEYQGVDAAKLVPVLTSALQIALEKIDSISDRLNALERK